MLNRTMIAIVSAFNRLIDRHDFQKISVAFLNPLCSFNCVVVILNKIF